MIKPRFVSGVILSVHGKKDYLLLQMVDGAITFIVDNGKGPTVSTFAPPFNKNDFCNGEWHSIHGKWTLFSERCIIFASLVVIRLPIERMINIINCNFTWCCVRDLCSLTIMKHLLGNGSTFWLLVFDYK